jgi:DNA invertase Pin-like site-specific DNA recombinase
MRMRKLAGPGGKSAGTSPLSPSLPRYIELVRVSSKGQADRDTPERQRRSLDQLRKVRAGVFVERIEAVASAALALDQTEEGRHLAELARAGAFDELRVSETDRVLGGRADDPRDRMAVLSLVLDARAVIVDGTGHVIDPADQSGMGEFDYYIRTFFAARERKLIARRTQDGRLRKALTGQFVGLGTFPWWLSWNKVEKKLEVDQRRVEIIVRAGESIIDGLALNQVVRRLNAEGVPPPRKTKWHVITLTRLLRNPALVGEYSQSLKGQKLPLAISPVVSRPWFDRVQAALDGGRRTRRRDCYRADALCRGRAFCGVCGELMQVLNAGKAGEYVYYRCKSHHHLNQLVPCTNAYHPVSEVDAAVWAQLEAIVLDEQVRRKAARIAEEEEPDSGRDEVARIEVALKKVDEFQVHLLRQKAAGLISDTVYDQMMAEQAGKRTLLTQDLDSGRRRMSGVAAWRDAAMTLNQRMAALARAIPQADFSVRRSILEKLVPHEKPYGIYVSPGRVEIRGLLVIDVPTPSRAFAMSAQSSESP